MAIATERIETVGAPAKLSWGAIFGGTFVALGIWILLYTFGLAIGLTAMDPENPASARGAGIFTGIWSLIAPLIALFVGGVVASRTAGIVTRTAGAIHGAVIWAMTLVLGVFLVAMALGSVVGGVASLGSQLVGAVGKAAPQAVQQGQAMGVDTGALLGPVNQRLQAQGMPPLTEQEFNAAASAAVRDSVRQGRVDRQILTQSLAQNTKLSQQDAEQVAGQLELQLKQGASQVGAQAQTTALRAAEISGRAMWGIFIALLVGLIAAVIGASVGVTRRQQRLAVGPPITTGPTGPTGRTPPTEVYP